MITVGGDLVLAGANGPYAIDPHQPANTALAYIEPCIVNALWVLPTAQLHCHARTAIAAKAEIILFTDVSQHFHVTAKAILAVLR